MTNPVTGLTLFNQALQQVEPSLSYASLCNVADDKPIDDVNKAFVLGALAILGTNQSALDIDLNQAVTLRTYGEVKALIQQVTSTLAV